MILADEINRTPPRRRRRCSKAMQEYQVTVGGVRYPLDRPLFVLATENPIEQEGTHPLPEAAARIAFMFNVVIGYPDSTVRTSASLWRQRAASTATINPIATGADLERARLLVRDIPAATNVISTTHCDSSRATRPDDASAPQPVASG
jgi:MoxR-like ATPase